jgi:hypothetical protein
VAETAQTETRRLAHFMKVISSCVQRAATIWRPTMNLTLTLGPLITLIAGILILMVPRLLNYIVAIYLIVIGLMGLLGVAGLNLR